MRDKNEFAKESVVEDYLADLLTEAVAQPIAVPNIEKEIAQKLLDQAMGNIVKPTIAEPYIAERNNEQLNRRSVTYKYEQAVISKKAQAALKAAELSSVQQIIQQVDKEIQSEVETKTSRAEVPASLSLQDSLDESFQALFFEVAGLTLAVPLIELGGIHHITKVSPLIGKPNWFMGVMIKNQDKFNVVDSALWVMPEKYDDIMAESLDYRFLINLGKTSWGLTCENLVTTVMLNKSDVKWRNNPGKRPWLAGMVKEKMCALINVSELVEMLQSGANSN